MSIQHGSLSVRLFHVPRPLPADAVERFAALALPHIGDIGTDTVQGWVTSRHDLDRNITPDTATYGGFLSLALAQAERRVSPSLLKAECRMEELAQENVTGTFLSKTVRREIRRSVEARLKASAQPQIKTISFVYDAQNATIWTTALSDRQVDALQIHFAQTIGFSLTQFLPDTAFPFVRDWSPVSFSADRDPSECEQGAGLDFLTWLMFRSELGAREANGIETFVEGPLHFIFGGAAAKSVVVKNGNPLVASATRSALVSGGKLASAKVSVIVNGLVFTFTFNADSFAFRGLRLPDPTELLDRVSAFQDRMGKLQMLRLAMSRLFEEYATHRDASVASMREWVQSRIVRD